MSDKEYRALINLLMTSDPWPAGEEDAITLKRLADREARDRGYEDWIDASHNFRP